MINKNIIALGFVSFFTDLASAIVTSILPLYIVYILQEGVDKLGFVVGVATFVSYGFRFVFGYFSDKYQIVKPFVVSGYLLSAITKPLLYFATSWVGIAGLRGLERVGKAIRSASKDSLISAYSDKNKSGKTFGFHKTMDIAGELIGSIIAFVVLFYFGYAKEIFTNLFAFTLLPGIISVIIVMFFVKDAPYKKKQTTKLSLKDDMNLLSTLLIFFAFTFFMFNDSFFLIKAKEAGYSLAYIPLLVILLNLTQTILSYFFGIKIDKIGSQKVLLIAFIFGIISIGFLYFDFIIFGFVALGVFLVASVNAIRAYISKNAKNKGTLFGVFYGGVAISGALGAIFTGMIWKYFGQDIATLVSLIALFLLLVFFIFIRKFYQIFSSYNFFR